VERYNGKFDVGFFGIPLLKKGMIFPGKSKPGKK
jgi:hypothetical protein